MCIVQKKDKKPLIYFNAAEHLIERDNIDRSSIDGLVFVSSTREWIIPDTAVSLQHRLGLSTETVCQDIN